MVGQPSGSMFGPMPYPYGRGRDSPRRGQRRAEATDHARRKSDRVVQRLCNRQGSSMDLAVGAVALTAVNEKERAGTDLSRLPVVVVEVMMGSDDRPTKNYRVATAPGLLIQGVVNRTSLNEQVGAQPEQFSLDGLVERFQGEGQPLDQASSIAAASAAYNARGGAKHVIDPWSCGCTKGKCSTFSCRCRKNGRRCTSTCHKGRGKAKVGCENWEDE